MAEPTLTPQVIDLEGITPVFEPVTAEGDDFVGSGRECIHIKNTHSAAQSVTITSQKKCNQGHEHHIAVEVPAIEDTTPGEMMIGAFPKDRFNGAEERVQLAYTGASLDKLTIAIIRLP